MRLGFDASHTLGVPRRTTKTNHAPSALDSSGDCSIAKKLPADIVPIVSKALLSQQQYFCCRSRWRRGHPRAPSLPRMEPAGPNDVTLLPPFFLAWPSKATPSAHSNDATASAATSKLRPAKPNTTRLLRSVSFIDDQPRLDPLLRLLDAELEPVDCTRGEMSTTLAALDPALCAEYVHPHM